MSIPILMRAHAFKVYIVRVCWYTLTLNMSHPVAGCSKPPSQESFMGKIKIAICGIGNCASALIQGIHYCIKHGPDQVAGLMNWTLGGYTPADINVVAAFDVDARKVGKDVSEAIFAPPNCATQFYPEVCNLGITVQMGKVLDGVSDHMQHYPDEQTHVIAQKPEPSKSEMVDHLKASGADMVVNYLPVGSQQATHFYAECALEAGLGFVNCIPVFLASDASWAEKFESAGLPIVGDDIKSQIGATILHRALAQVFADRGAEVDQTYQLNIAGNTDFLNMLERERLQSKKISKTEAVQTTLHQRLEDGNIHVGPSDYVAWKKDNKTCHIKIKGRVFGGVPVDVELRLDVEDSPNSAEIVLDAIRACKLGLDRGIGGPLIEPSAFLMKHPPQPMADSSARKAFLQFAESGS